jgi:3-oxoacyl-[acyl-carrier protein] reductase
MGYHYDGLKDKVAVVTGASQNLGAAMATALAEQGCRVAVVGRGNQAGAEAVAARIRASGGVAAAWCADLSREELVEPLFRDIATQLGAVDILVNNAGGWKKKAQFWEMTFAGWREVLSDNLDTTFLCSEAVVPTMMERGWGRIINMSSRVGRAGRVGGETSYSAAKGGIIAMTRQMAVDLGPYGITVNAIAPGSTVKETGPKFTDEYYETLCRQLPLRRLGMPEDQAAAVCFLASPAASWITGVTVEVDGGMSVG